MRNSSNLSRIGAAALIVMVFLLLGYGLFTYLTKEKGVRPQQIQQPTTSSPVVSSTYVTIQGKVISLDLEELQFDGDGKYEVETDEGIVYAVRLTSGHSNCSIYKQNSGEAVVGTINQNSDVEVRGRSDGKVLRICDKGTYIKAL